MLDFRAWGDRASGKVPLVLLHGFGGSAGDWSRIAEALSKDVPILAFDLPGHGASLHLEKTGVKASASAVLEALDKLSIPSFHLAGHSMGGAAAALIALQKPDHVRSLTLLAPGGFGPDIASGLLASYAKATTLQELREVSAAMHASANPPSEEMLQRQLAMRAQPGQVEALVSLEKRLSKEGKQGELDRDVLAELPMPLHVLWGDVDSVVTFSQTDDLPEGMTLHVLRGCGHMLIDEAPDLITQILQEITG
ncbi:alpha/beta fold hydrolase [Limoniibacter endophyticus]|uniref:Dihydrolipoamide acetyltransferase n=1 Tax=Limoniibacter endophyticus TaxID=1565040 RepID=A0A8J3DN34_9HYPH|nr:alpha/beta fold hydrolase [Limoniibacter endophyticus]GHC65460.1 dihydrolipoamide acetyltransferase [Limoniibacter endophyticus]